MKPIHYTSRAWLAALIATLLSPLPFSEMPSQTQPSGEALWQDPLVVATGPAYVGPWRMNDSDFHYVDDATPALRDDGEALVLWVDNRRKDVFLQRYSPESHPRFQTPVNVSRTRDVFSWLPRAIFTEEDHVFVAWQEIVFSGGSHGGEIFFARSTDGGASIPEPTSIWRDRHTVAKTSTPCRRQNQRPATPTRHRSPLPKPATSTSSTPKARRVSSAPPSFTTSGSTANCSHPAQAAHSPRKQQGWRARVQPPPWPWDRQAMYSFFGNGTLTRTDPPAAWDSPGPPMAAAASPNPSWCPAASIPAAESTAACRANWAASWPPTAAATSPSPTAISSKANAAASY